MERLSGEASLSLKSLVKTKHVRCGYEPWSQGVKMIPPGLHLTLSGAGNEGRVAEFLWIAPADVVGPGRNSSKHYMAAFKSQETTV